MAKGLRKNNQNIFIIANNYSSMFFWAAMQMVLAGHWWFIGLFYIGFICLFLI